MLKALGIDIGGTKIALGLVNEMGEILQRHQVATVTSDRESLFTCLCQAIDDILLEADMSLGDLSGIGIGLPGKVDVDQGIAVFQNNIPWPDFPLVQRLQERYGKLPVKLDNDVKVAAYAEYRLAHLGPKDLFGYVTLSTGIAATNILDHQILRGQGFSGEIGFLPVIIDGQVSRLEETCAGPGIEKRGRVAYQEPDLTTKEIFQRWNQGDPVAQAIIESSAQGIAQALYGMICYLDPKMIVMGGSLSNHQPQFIEAIKQSLAKLLHAEQAHILDHIRVSEIKGDNGIVGAGFLVL